MHQRGKNSWKRYVYGAVRFDPMDRLSGGQKARDTQRFTSQKIKTSNGDFVNLIRAEVRDAKAVKRTVSIPKWMDDKVIQSGLSLSKVLQDALVERLG